MKEIKLTEEQTKMLKDACLVVIALMSGKDSEEDKAELLKYKELFDYINS
jgi:hypothetical protein